MSPMLRKSLAAYAIAGSQLPPLMAVVRLYEKALTLAVQARDAAREHRYEDHWRGVERATAILAGLDSILDMKKGGEAARELRAFYRVNIKRLGSAATRKDPVRAMEVVIVQLTVMTDTWRRISAERENPAPAAQSARGGEGTDASAKQSHASVIGGSMDHAHGSSLGYV